MTLVVDASVAAKWLLEEAGTQQARELLMGDQPLLAPTLILSEVANAIWKAVARGATAEPLMENLKEVPANFSKLVSIPALVDMALRLATHHNHPIYDCLYVALSLREAAPLITADQRLVERFAGIAEVRLL